MEKTLKEKIDDALVELLDTWEILQTIGSIEVFSLLINDTIKYDALLKEYQQTFDNEMDL